MAHFQVGIGVCNLIGLLSVCAALYLGRISMEFLKGFGWFRLSQIQSLFSYRGFGFRATSLMQPAGKPGFAKRSTTKSHTSGPAGPHFAGRGQRFSHRGPAFRAFRCLYMQMVDFYNQRAFLESVIFTSANYIEILAFVGTSRVTKRIRKSLLKSRCQLFGWCTARSRRVRTLRI